MSSTSFDNSNGAVAVLDEPQAALAAGTSEYLRHGVKQLPHLGEFTAGNWLGNLTATEAWRSSVGGGEIAYLMKNTWTLCYEEQFYAVVGLMLLLAGTRFFAAAG